MRAAYYGTGLGVIDRSVAGADELASLIADRAAGVSAHGAVSDESAVGLADHDVGVAVARVGVGRSLPRGQLARGSELDRSGGQRCRDIR